MSGFRRAKAEQAALKMAIYGPPGSGKTFTALLLAEGLAALTKKRVAYIDTEHGTDFYCQEVPTRRVHPAAFDFDALYSKSVTEIVAAAKSLKTEEYGVIVIDSMTHVWEACIAAYSGNQTRIGTIPMHAWGKIKKPHKDLMAHLLSSPMHVIMCGRQGVQYETNEETQELQAVGLRMKSEGEVPYEPHILLRMEAIKPAKTMEIATIMAYAEKDRTGILSGRSFANPTFDSIVRPLLPLLGDKQAHIATTEETSATDAETIATDDRERADNSNSTLRDFVARIQLCKDIKSLKELGKTITPQVKAKMLTADVAALRDGYQTRERELSGQQVVAVAEPTEAQ